MGKGFMKFRVSRIIRTFHSCRSKDPATLPTNPIPLFGHHPSTLSPTTESGLHHPSSSSVKRHVSSAFSSARYGCLRSRPSPEPSHTRSSSSQKWHVIAKTKTHNHNYESTPPRRKIYNSAASDTENEDDVVYLPPSRTRKNRRRRKSFQKIRISTSSDSGLFSEDDEDRTLFSTDSTSPRSFHRHVNKSENQKNGRKSLSYPSPARLSEFMRKLAPCRAVADGKVRESFAVVKKSDDPYEDFKKSMVEMVMEKQMFEVKELEELLRCFLTLNSDRHHEAIVRAFTEIWKGLFCTEY
ncbi:unnamed protein product [Amaranthus hypochondriacus]